MARPWLTTRPGKGLLLCPHHTQLCPARHEENHRVSDIRNAITEQIYSLTSVFLQRKRTWCII